ncbi:MAG: hypothetical protein HN366_09395 [Deltaproteobacteria bacterium]|nr:hypothetical protein [Deltaproteobacteria bacterium]
MDFIITVGAPFAQNLARKLRDIPLILLTRKSGILKKSFPPFPSFQLRELEENNIRISCRAFVRHQGVMAGA